MIAFTAPRSAGDVGSIRVEAQTVTIREGSFIGQAVQGAGRSGDVTVTTDTLVMVSSQISSASAPGSTGDAGDVLVQARTVTLTNGAQITSGTLGAGRGGNVTVIAQGALTLDGFGTIVIAPGQEVVVPSLITASSQLRSTGDAGSVRVEAQTVTLTKGAQIQSGTLGTGRGGNVTVMARDAVTVDGFGGRALSLITASSEPGATGDAGSVRVEAQTVTATRGAQIISAAFGAGQGGNVTVMGRERVTFRGTSPEGEDLLGLLVPGDRTFPSGAFANSHGAGAPGTVHVTAPEVTLAEGGRISSLNITSDKAGGTVIVHAPDTLTISGVGSSLRTRSFGPGRGGDITVNAGTVSLTAGADISAASIKTGDATGSGDAGQITIKAGALFRSRQGTVTAEATTANGGEITLTAKRVALTDSTITTIVPGGRGGNVTIGPGVEFLILNDSHIYAQALREAGGNITLDTTLLASPLSTFEASGKLNIGQVGLPLSFISAPLSQAFAQSAPLLGSPCAARLHEGTVSTLVERGRDGVPATPDGVLPSRLPLAPLDTATLTHEGGLPSAARAWALGARQRGSGEPLALRGWAASVDALRLLPGDCASR
jgi:large exoprotein involved in heme utilization and adhesion